jgi:hypothetical protein
MDELTNRMAEEGYVPGFPGSMETANHAIEAELCINGVCEKCNHMGLEYKPFVDRSSQDFRTFSQCPNCGNAEEL